jgi:predicted regulator of Ras-like GTPase activity (Roadblock/LC7/MglB family)
LDKSKIEKIVAEAMTAHPDLEGVIVSDMKGNVLFGHTLSGSVKHSDVASLSVKIAANSAQMSSGLDKGGLKEVSIESEKGYMIILGDVKLVLAAIAGDGARESMGLLRLALKRALVSMVK